MRCDIKVLNKQLNIVVFGLVVYKILK